jgi:hypothetical protein
MKVLNVEVPNPLAIAATSYLVAQFHRHSVAYVKQQKSGVSERIQGMAKIALEFYHTKVSQLLLSPIHYLYPGSKFEANESSSSTESKISVFSKTNAVALLIFGASLLYFNSGKFSDSVKAGLSLVGSLKTKVFG